MGDDEEAQWFEDCQVATAMQRLDIYLEAFMRADKPIRFGPRPYDQDREDHDV